MMPGCGSLAMQQQPRVARSGEETPSGEQQQQVVPKWDPHKPAANTADPSNRGFVVPEGHHERYAAARASVKAQ